MEKLLVVHLVKKFPDLYKTWIFNTCSQELILHRINSFHSLLNWFSKGHVNVNINLPLCLRSGVFRSGFPAKILYAFVYEQTSMNFGSFLHSGWHNEM